MRAALVLDYSSERFVWSTASTRTERVHIFSLFVENVAKVCPNINSCHNSNTLPQTSSKYISIPSCVYSKGFCSWLKEAQFIIICAPPDSSELQQLLLPSQASQIIIKHYPSLPRRSAAALKPNNTVA